MSKLYSFLYDHSGKRRIFDLRAGPRHESREASGVWVSNGEAWKIFPSMKQWNRIHDDYKKAKDKHLSISSYRLFPGTVTDNRGLASDGFALVTRYITHPARFFTLKTGALQQHIELITDDAILERIQQSLSAALTVGLKDPQGFINKYATSNPIVFIDVHTTSKQDTALKAVCDHVKRRRAILQQQRKQGSKLRR